MPNLQKRIEYNFETKEYSLSKFKVFLGGDTRTDRFEITDEEENDYEREIEDMVGKVLD